MKLLRNSKVYGFANDSNALILELCNTVQRSKNGYPMFVSYLPKKVS